MHVLMRVFWAVSSVVEHCLHTAGVRSSNLLPPTKKPSFDMPKWLIEKSPTEIILKIHVQPNAKMSAWAGIFGDSLKIRLNAPPADGKANAALIQFLSDFLDLPKSAVGILSGETSRQKRLLIKGDAQKIKNRLPSFE